MKSYEYDAFGREWDAVATDNNPFRYCGEYDDKRTETVYLRVRYYDSAYGRFTQEDPIRAGTNWYIYCDGNPVNRIDPSGQFWITALVVAAVVVAAATLSGCSSQQEANSPRSDLANAPDLDINTASPRSYNCYGNGIGKQIIADPTGYVIGDSTRKTFEAVKNDLGRDNVRELDSIHDPIGDDEFKVAMKCGPTDYHFIRLTEDGWYNKSGKTYQGL